MGRVYRAMCILICILTTIKLVGVYSFKLVCKIDYFGGITSSVVLQHDMLKECKATFVVDDGHRKRYHIESGDKVNTIESNGGQEVLSVSSHSRLVFDIKYNKKIFRYIDHYTVPTNHIMSIDFLDRRINAPLQDKLSLLRQLDRNGLTAYQGLQRVFPRIFDTVSQVKRALDTDAKDSKIKFVPDAKDMFVITKQADGQVLDTDRLILDMYNALLLGRTECSAHVSVIKPVVVQQYNREATKFRAGFSTDFASSNANRKHNIGLSLKYINGTVLQPGEIFSFNKVVGARSAKRGFVESKIIVNGKFVEGIGGGVCQVSTTLYNAAVRADMCILSVRNHSLPIHYVEPSFDAMVNASSSDLKFENTTTHPIFIRAVQHNDRIIIEFYGCNMRYRIVPESEVVDRVPPPSDCEEIIDKEYKYFDYDAYSGQRVQVVEPKGGLVSKGYLRFYDNNNNLIMRRHIRTDKYSPQKGLVAIAP